ncbi:hypothetical protein BCV70DRAFT_201681 [Testicularia cyperi]|uniref:RRM domain-containing protein n=1 Tax=Testicularia cyperi TaxID=1882483 RepID=A0A317XKQ1_9BASI|nr:hypothetical protein BCV70DRAFT_201681 [Testicularia cyperi]
MSPPPGSAPSPYNPAGGYNPAAASSESPFSTPAADPYAASNEFAGGADRQYPMAAGAMSTRGGRGGYAGAAPADPRLGQGRPPTAGVTGHQPMSSVERPPSAPYGYDPSGGFETAGPGAYPTQPPFGASGAPMGQPSYQAGPPRPQPAPYGNYGARPPPPTGPAGYGGQPHGHQYGGPPRGGFGGPRPPGRFGGRGGFGRGAGGGGGHDKFGDSEKPCRTLFVRNVQFETDSKQVKEQFEQFGEIKTFFDMVNKRGIAFITYYDIRAASAAMDGMKGAPFGGRPIDIHYSLPREEDKAQRCDREKNQGTLFTTLKQPTEPLTDEMVYNVFGEFGDIKLVRSLDQPNSRFVEYFDSRGCQLAHDRLNGQTFMGGQWDVKFAWDLVANAADSPAPGGPGAMAARPPRPPIGWGRPPAPQPQAAAPLSDRAPLPAGYPGFEESTPAAAAPAYGGYSAAPTGPAAAHVRSPVPPTGPPADNGWGNRASSASSTSGAADVKLAAGQKSPDADRLEQAQKVQQLLASLGAAAKGGAAAPTAPVGSTPTPVSQPTSTTTPSASLSPPPPAAPTPAPGLPANIAALLQQASGAPKPAQPPKPQSPPGSGGTQDNGQQSMHQLLSMLSQNRSPQPPPSS